MATKNEFMSKKWTVEKLRIKSAGMAKYVETCPHPPAIKQQAIDLLNCVNEALKIKESRV
jgi:hypothetical protein